MFENVAVNYQLEVIRERHAMLRRQAEYARAYRLARGRHRFRSRHRR